MSVKIRLSRSGTKKRPYYRIVVADVRSPRDGRYIEKVGTHNPMLPKDHEDRLHLVEDRIKYWLSKGAQPTDRVAIFLGKAGLMEMPAQANNPQKAKPKAKAQERLAEKEEKAQAAKEAAAEAAAAPVVEEAPVEEVVAEEAPAEEVVAEEAAKA